jgi:dCMP deaminase
MDAFYMDVAERTALMSHARRSKVGAVLTKDNNIISYGWNGTPAGDDNNCEDEIDDRTLKTKPEVLHAESNTLLKLTSSGNTGAKGATLYVTLSPCFECSKLIKQAGITRVVFKSQYRDDSGINFLRNRNVVVEKIVENENGIK